MTREDCRLGRLVPVLPALTEPESQPVNAVYYRNTQLVARITCFLDYLSEQMGEGLL
jgi:DNA-binding transcriptional LysR family regulator